MKLPGRCSFCSKSVDEVRKLIAGPYPTAICDECVDLCIDIMEDETQLVARAQRPKTPSAREIYAELDAFVIGQDRAKRVLSVAAHNHFKRRDSEVSYQKSNVLLIGPSGCGKTLLASTLAKLLKVPFAIADCTKMTEAGYVGDDVEDVLDALLANANGDMKAAEWGVVLLDEADKVARRDSSSTVSRDVSGEGVQQALLRMVEGSMSRVGGNRQHRGMMGERKEIDTSNILFIASGAFEGLAEIVSRRLGRRQIGFGENRGGVAKDAERLDALSRVEPKDLVSFGLIPELVGRFPIVSALSELDDHALVRVLIEPRGALVEQYQSLFAASGMHLAFTPESLVAIARAARARGTGARGLRAIVEDLLLDAMFELSDYEKETEFTVQDNLTVLGATPLKAIKGAA